MGKFDHQFDERIAAAKTLGLRMVYSTSLEKVLEKLAEERTRIEDAGWASKDEDLINIEVDEGDAVVCLCHDADRTMEAFEVLAMVVKFPNQKDWVFAFTNDFESLHLFVGTSGPKSASQTITRVQAEVKRLRAIKTKK